MDQGKKAQETAKVVIPKTAKEFAQWLERTRLNREQDEQADKVRLSFNSLALNKNNPAALEAAQRMHDADMAKLEAMLT